MKSITNFSKTECRILLHFLGIEQDEQPNKMKELRSLLNVYSNKYYEEYETAYNFVIKKELPQGTVKKVISLTDAREIIVDEVSVIKESALGQLEKIFKVEGEKVLLSIVNACEKVIETESKKFNVIKHVIYNDKKEVKEIKGVVCEEFETILQLAQERINVLMIGPSGAGKTHISAQVAEALDLPFASQSCSAGVSESAFTGKLLPLGDHGKFEYVESDFVRIYENGGVFLFDEIDAADANVLVFLNQSLANGSFHCSQRIKNTLIKKHENFIAIAAANTFGTGADSLYTGRNSLDAATLDRFRMGTVLINYSSIVEEKIVDSEVLTFGRTIRQKIESHKLKKILSTRFMKDATTMKTGQRWSMSKIQDMYFADWSREELAVIGGKLKFEEIVEKYDENKNISWSTTGFEKHKVNDWNRY